MMRNARNSSGHVIVVNDDLSFNQTDKWEISKFSETPVR